MIKLCAIFCILFLGNTNDWCLNFSWWTVIHHFERMPYLSYCRVIKSWKKILRQYSVKNVFFKCCTHVKAEFKYVLNLNMQWLLITFAYGYIFLLFVLFIVHSVLCLVFSPCPFLLALSGRSNLAGRYL
jgi:hypothetical protein